MSTILLTGFEAFGSTPINPAEQVALRLDGKEIAGGKVVSRVIPNTFYKCIDVVVEAIEQLKPQAVVMMGECGGRSMITVERIAQNLNDCARYGVEDNDGNILQDKMTIEGGPAAYYSTLPLRAMVQTMRTEGVPADISDAAGTFCCNHLMYGVLHYISENKLNIRAGWIHLPHLPVVAALEENLGAPSMSTKIAARGVRAGISAICSHAEDVEVNIPSRLQI
ncbi:MAG: pyroglutamyl-peptidase I [Hyphomicrobiales bacterium]